MADNMKSDTIKAVSLVLVFASGVAVNDDLARRVAALEKKVTQLEATQPRGVYRRVPSDEEIEEELRLIGNDGG